MWKALPTKGKRQANVKANKSAKGESEAKGNLKVNVRPAKPERNPDPERRNHSRRMREPVSTGCCCGTKGECVFRKVFIGQTDTGFEIDLRPPAQRV